ncbi:hypothetical protein [Actinosynnema mirum]|uniref:Uncharacterized protein n=1 Tax=Actinosynnema mirum (strain ATCC 29888 / DSM 43827 / JCM 3225 / NBRC 14064 / NCIMB 13271 / NRRL B-12336 / IMRU 3971 / 101) TaxID=446462 RepID=C6WF20_ACTMD|nr:hypothetical protein [Actinosynnema mirum]ACU34152.1 hypothetical protein Amir_0181 [Actinosynnema mirum DSM 43827]
MNTPATYPDGLTWAVLNALQEQVSREDVPAAEPTSALVSGEAQMRRNLRVLRRALNGVTAHHGVGLMQAVAELRETFPHLLVTTAEDSSQVEPIASPAVRRVA